MENRRQVLKSISMIGAAAVIPAAAEAKPSVDDCDHYAKNLASAMSRKYGGEWIYKMTPEDGVFLMCQKC